LVFDWVGWFLGIFWLSFERCVLMNFVFSVVVLQLSFNLGGDVDFGGCFVMGVEGRWWGFGVFFYVSPIYGVSVL